MKKRKRTGNDHLMPGIGPCSQDRTETAGRSHRRRGLLVGFALCVFAAGLLAPQFLVKQKPMPVKSISGAVLTSSSMGVPGASVMLTDLETRRTDAMYTGANGKYNFSGLNPNDDYQLRAKYKKLESGVRNVSSLDSRSQIVINLVLSAPDQAGSGDPQ